MERNAKIRHIVPGTQRNQRKSHRVTNTCHMHMLLLSHLRGFTKRLSLSLSLTLCLFNLHSFRYFSYFERHKIYIIWRSASNENIMEIVLTLLSIVCFTSNGCILMAIASLCVYRFGYIIFKLAQYEMICPV